MVSLSSAGKESTCNAGDPGSIPGLGRSPGEGAIQSSILRFTWWLRTCNTGDLGLIPGLGRFPGRGHGNPLQYSCLENHHGQRSLESYSLWGCKELDMTASKHRIHSTLWNCKSTIFPPDRSVLSVIKRNQFRGKKLSFLHINTLHLENSSANTNAKTSFLVSINFLHTSMNELYIHHYFILSENIY